MGGFLAFLFNIFLKCLSELGSLIYCSFFFFKPPTVIPFLYIICYPLLLSVFFPPPFMNKPFFLVSSTHFPFPFYFGFFPSWVLSSFSFCDTLSCIQVLFRSSDLVPRSFPGGSLQGTHFMGPWAVFCVAQETACFRFTGDFFLFVCLLCLEGKCPVNSVS